MKLKLTPVSLVGLILLVIICFSLPDCGICNNILEIPLPKPEFDWAENYVDGAIPVENSFMRCFVKAGLLPTPYDNYLAVRHVTPVWECALSEYVSSSVSFFRPIMVIIFFLFFYRSSRNSAGQDRLFSVSSSNNPIPLIYEM